MRCPFGCRKHHREQCSTVRSVAYYRTDAGRKKKKDLNGHRKRGGPSVSSPPQKSVAPSPQVADAPRQAPVSPPSAAPIPSQPPANEASPEAASAKLELRLPGITLDGPMLRNSPLLPYVRTVVNVLERLRLGLPEVLGRLLTSLRQRSMVLRRRRDYVLEYLHQHPP